MPTPDFSKVWASNSPLPEYTFSDADYLTGWDFVGSAPPTKNEFDAWFRFVDEKLNYLYRQLQDTASKLYPVGSVYISFNSADPSTLFGGTWVRLKDTFLLANGDSYAPNTTGGSATKTISTNNLPKHTHTCGNNGLHSHTRGSMNISGTISNLSSDDDLLIEAESATGTGALRLEDKIVKSKGGKTGGSQTGYDTISFNSSRAGAWTGSTSSEGLHNHNIGETGSNLPLNIMPPYTTVYAWRRTA